MAKKPPKKKDEDARYEELLAAVPGGGAIAPSSPIGVPTGYQPVTGGQVRYLKGDEFIPAGLPPEEVARLQESLDAAGLYNPKDVYPKGWWDGTSVRAYKRLLTHANSSGQDYGRSLSQLGAQAARDRQRGGAARRQSRLDALTPPVDLANVADKTAQRLMGRRLNNQEVQQFISSFQALERAGTTMPSPSAFAEQEIQQMRPTEVYGKNFVTAFETFSDMLGGETDVAQPPQVEQL